MDVERVNYILEKAIIGFQADELEALQEFKVLSPGEMSARTGMKLPKSIEPAGSSYKVPTPAQMKKKVGMRLPRKPRKPKAQAEATVEFWQMYLIGKLTQYDTKQRDRNIYRLGHLLGAAQKVEDETKGVSKQSSEAAIEQFRKSMNRHFISTFAPVRAVNKAIDRYYMTGKRPKYGK